MLCDITYVIFSYMTYFKKRTCYITCVILCYITCFMLCHITYVMLSYINITYTMLCYMCCTCYVTCVVLCSITCVMLCYITYVMLCYITYVIIFLEFHSTKQGLPLVDSWSRGLD